MGDLVILILATWRLTALLVYESWFEWLRQMANVDFVDDRDVPLGFFGKILSCFWCTSLLMAIVCCILLAADWDFILWPLAASSGAILLNHLARVNRYAEG